MNAKTLLSSGPVLAAALLGPAIVHAAPSTPIEGVAVVRLEDGFAIDEINQTYGTTTIADVPGSSRPHYLLDLPDGLTTQEFIDLVSGDARVKDARFDFSAEDPLPGTQSFFFPAARLEYVNQPARHVAEMNRPPVIGGASGEPGEPVVVAVIDTGVDLDHPALVDRLVPGISFLPNDPSTDDVGDGIDEDGDGDTDEIAGHGTFVAGLITLTAPDARIMPIRVMTSDGLSTSFRVAQGIFAAIDAGVDVINVSLGTTDDAGVIEDAIEVATELGIVVVASVGNDDAPAPRYPAGFAEESAIIAVAGTTNDDVRATFSNYGAAVTLSAPAVDLVSTHLDGTYASASGTSFAAPLISGTVARMRASSPTATPAELRQWLQLTAASIDAENPDFTGLLGAGRIIVAAALAEVGGTAPLIEGDVTGDWTIGIADLNTVLGQFNMVTSAGDATGDGIVNIADLSSVLAGWGGH